MAIPFWLDNPTTWDRPVVAGINMPGICDVSGTGLAKLDKKTSPGSSGATLTYLGADPVEATITCTIWTKEQLATLEQVIAKLTPMPGKGARQPVTISHPLFLMHRVTKLFVQKIGMLKDSSRIKNAKELTINFVQFFPPTGGQTGTFGASSAAPALSTLDQSSGASGGASAVQTQNATMLPNVSAVPNFTTSSGADAWATNAPSKTGSAP